jgi:hypothetical protein
VHYASPLWIETQARYLRKHIAIPYRTWASLQRIDPSYSTYFDRVVDQTGRHSDKLNHLAIEIAAEASEDDLLMFLDGDAFPIADPMPLIVDGLARAPLVAVRRLENLGDPQPHPCFCVTTVKAWWDIGGDWSQGYRWTNAEGRRVTDVGGNLLRRLELTGTPWVEVLRSNRKELDPLLFGIYGDIVYHHGAGFRGYMYPGVRGPYRGGHAAGVFTNLTRFHASQAPPPRPISAIPVLRRLRRRRDWHKRQAWERNTKERLTRISDAVIAKIQEGDSAWLAEFM